jgi:Na+-driven multidrug efflux pump
MSISIIMQWGFQMPCAWLIALAASLGVVGVWWSYPVANCAGAALCLLWFRFGRWSRLQV